MKNRSLFAVLSLIIISLLSSCGGKNIEDIIPKSTSFHFSRGTEVYITEGELSDSITTEIYVPGKIVTMDVTSPVKNDFVHINLAEPTKSFFEEKIHESFLGKHITYRNVLGAQDIKLYLVPDVINDLKPGKYTITFAVLDEKEEYKQKDMNITIVAKKKK
ncbi:hypothetical protein [Flammeovirga pacifica]|uniref:DUF4625 domain-containing protein n=1 Tax=Flammeovirga pacifica TaxID=915059 RepID=A0A1S1YZZ9_FLAPC|nr:hypothetical protein [Flammeovirga pacifica]OHX66596.1 hypothetical protein NH26_09605 [Flammeovirga pacifica]